jgi:hypothetical protein
VAKRDRIGNPKPGSIRYEARSRGVTEAAIRRERALAKGQNPKTIGRGHARPELGEIPPALEKAIRRFSKMDDAKQEAFINSMRRTANRAGMSMHTLWTLLVSPNGKRK